ncbi:MAG: hypothetical protein CM15mP65_04630 [Crocinitomicaceae bacterium]|nr:MAG: hypothetical protein CM15mP65_04630 [Crocinitomicaceae bacterium]
MRKEPKDQSEMVSQILFGQHFKILETKPNWVRIQLADDDYEGWICAKQYDEITYEDYDNFNLNNFPKACDKLGYLEDINTGEITPIPTGSTLPYFHQGTVRVRQKKFKFKGALASDNIKDIGDICTLLFKLSLFMGWKKYFRYRLQWIYSISFEFIWNSNTKRCLPTRKNRRISRFC